MIVTVIATTPGLGKTLIAESLSVFRGAESTKTLLIDGDVQGNASRRAAEREQSRQPYPVPVHAISGKGLGPELEYLSYHYKDIIIDGENRDCLASRSALIASRVAIVLLEPEAQGSIEHQTTVKQLSTARLFNPRLRVIIACVATHGRSAIAQTHSAKLFADKITASTVIWLAADFLPQCLRQASSLSAQQNVDQTGLAQLYEEVYKK